MAMWVFINVSGLRFKDLAKMGSARREPHKAYGDMHHIFNQAFHSVGSPLCHLSRLHRHFERPASADRNSVRLLLPAIDTHHRAGEWPMRSAPVWLSARRLQYWDGRASKLRIHAPIAVCFSAKCRIAPARSG
jgi:hypothetical protein